VWRSLLVATAVCLVEGTCARLAAGQAPTGGVQATLNATTLIDDNVFSQTLATADTILRLTPGVAVSRVRPRLSLTGSYSMDAERYGTHAELNTLQARQGGVFTAAFRATSRTSLSWMASQSSTLNPSEFNALTALTLGRVRAMRSQGSSILRHDLAKRTAFDIAYDFSRDELTETRIVTLTHGLDAHLTHQIGTRVSTYVRVNGRLFDFGTGPTPRVTSSLAAGGWTMRGRVTHATVEAGAQQTNGTWGYTAEATLGRTLGPADVLGSYGRGIATAIGVSGPVTSDHLQVRATFQRRAGASRGGGAGRATTRPQLGLAAGAFRSQLPSGQSNSYQWSVQLTQPLTRRLSLQGGYDAAIQRSRGGILPLVGEIRRNRLLFALSLSTGSVR
jgi:hypothetical protein